MATMILPLLQAVNSKAVRMMKANKFKDAADLFSEGLGMLDHCQLPDETQGSLMNGIFSQFGTLALVPLANDQDIPQDHKSSFTAYTNAIMLTPNEDTSNDAQQDNDELRNLMRCILLYNFGLCLHLEAMLGLDEAEECLFEACTSYEMALSILSRSIISSSIHYQDDTDRTCFVMLELALLNNCGSVYNFFMDKTQVHSCLHQMLLLVNSMSQKYGWQEQFPQVLSPFAHNIMFNADLNIRPAPMA